MVCVLFWLGLFVDCECWWYIDFVCVVFGDDGLVCDYFNYFCFCSSCLYVLFVF